MPSKALLRPGEVLAAARRVPAARPAVTGGVDVEAALRSRDGFTSGWNDESQAQWLAGMGVDVVRGGAGWPASGRSRCSRRTDLR